MVRGKNDSIEKESDHLLFPGRRKSTLIRQAARQAGRGVIYVDG